MISTGLLPIFLTFTTTSAIQSTACVAPRDFCVASLSKGAVVMMDGNPDNSAKWISGSDNDFASESHGVNVSKNIVPYWPTEPEPPKIMMSCPLYCPQGVARFW